MSLLLLAACDATHLAPPADRSAEARDEAGAVLVFADDWTETASGALVAGEPVDVVYDIDRLTRCRGRQFGHDAWAISGAWRIDGGPVTFFPVVMPTTPVVPSLVPDRTGELELWFENTDVFGCIAHDSDFGANYRFPVVSSSIAPDWMGAASVAIGRGEVVPHPLDDGFLFDTASRQRATVAELTFRVWEPGVTDRDNPELWEQLDVRVHWRFDPGAELQWDYVDFDGREGNDARYAVPLRAIDPLPGNTIVDPADCPAFPITDDGVYVEATAELYFSVNGVELRPDGGGAWSGRFQDYSGLYAVCP